MIKEDTDGWPGHMLRLLETAPVKLAVKEALVKVRNPKEKLKPPGFRG